MSLPCPSPAGLAGIALAMAGRMLAIVDGLKKAIGVAAARDRAVAQVAMLLWNRLSRLVRLFDAMAARMAACRPARASRAGATRAAAARDAARDAAGKPRLPRDHAWLIKLTVEAAAAASQVRYLLADADMAALLAAEPAAMRLLRPLCRMLDVDIPGPPPRPRETPSDVDVAGLSSPRADGAGLDGAGLGDVERSVMPVGRLGDGVPYRPPRDG